MNRLILVILGFLLLIFNACEKPEAKTISLGKALALAVDEVFEEDASADEPVTITLEIVENPESWDFLFEWEPGSPGMHARILVSKKNGTIEVLPGL